MKKPIENHIKYLKKVPKINSKRGRCVFCDARDFCTVEYYKCTCSYEEQYVDIRKQRKEKLNKIISSIHPTPPCNPNQ